MPLDPNTMAHFAGGSDGTFELGGPFKNFHITSGVKYVLENGGGHGAGYLINAIASFHGKMMKSTDRRLHDFQIWTFRVDLEKRVGLLLCKADTDSPIVATQTFQLCDFDQREIKFYVERAGNVMTIMLPCER